MGVKMTIFWSEIGSGLENQTNSQEYPWGWSIHLFMVSFQIRCLWLDFRRIVSLPPRASITQFKLL